MSRSPRRPRRRSSRTATDVIWSWATPYPTGRDLSRENCENTVSADQESTHENRREFRSVSYFTSRALCVSDSHVAVSTYCIMNQTRSETIVVTLTCFIATGQLDEIVLVVGAELAECLVRRPGLAIVRPDRRRDVGSPAIVEQVVAEPDAPQRPRSASAGSPRRCHPRCRCVAQRAHVMDQEVGERVEREPARYAVGGRVGRANVVVTWQPLHPTWVNTV